MGLSVDETPLTVAAELPRIGKRFGVNSARFFSQTLMEFTPNDVRWGQLDPLARQRHLFGLYSFS